MSRIKAAFHESLSLENDIYAMDCGETTVKAVLSEALKSIRRLEEEIVDLKIIAGIEPWESHEVYMKRYNKPE